MVLADFDRSIADPPMSLVQTTSSHSNFCCITFAARPTTSIQTNTVAKSKNQETSTIFALADLAWAPLTWSVCFYPCDERDRSCLES